MAIMVMLSRDLIASLRRESMCEHDDNDYDAVCVCLSRKIITSNFRAERPRREVSRLLGLGLVRIMKMMMVMMRKEILLPSPSLSETRKCT